MIAEDIATDPLWRAWRELALGYGLRACVSVPILNSKNEVLGTFAFYYPVPGSPPPQDLELIEVSRAVAGIAIEQARIEGERDKLVTRLESALRARDVFLSVASHELRTPIASASMLLQSALRGSRGARDRAGDSPAWESLLVQQLERLEKRVEQLLDVSRLSGSSTPLELESLDMTELVADVVRRQLARRDARGGDVSAGRSRGEIDIEPSPPQMGLWDRRRLTSALDEIIASALKFGEGRLVTISLDENLGIVRVRIAVPGVVLSEDDRTRALRGLEWCPAPDHYGGFGFGLWLARESIEHMGGDIHVESRSGVTGNGGMAFVVLLRAREERR